MTMEWTKLLSDTRFRVRGKKEEIDARNPFEDDYSRIIFSSAFRRLQDKTQVFPLERDSLVRTRLTHSIEVSNIGRSIGLSVEGYFLRNGIITDGQKGFIPSIVASAGLIHDLGNPPFGHYGEDAFKTFYSGHREKLDDLNENQRKDLLHFDGNVQTFRHLTKLQFLKDEHSYNLSFPTLATIIKYPYSSMEGNVDSENICQKKYGYFCSEKNKFDEIRENLGIPGNARFPLTYILEAADDIAYSANDLEDGVRKKIINSDNFLIRLKNFVEENRIPDKDLLVEVYNRCKKIKDEDKSGIENCIIEQFRIEAHSRMIKSAVEAFVDNDNYREIMDGEFKCELLEKSKAKNIREFFSSFARKEIFSNKDVLKLEIMGEEVIKGLLEKFFVIVNAKKETLEKTKNKEGKIYHLISDNFRFLHEHYTKDSKFDRIQLINDYVCGMTDSYALQTYRKLTGIEL